MQALGEGRATLSIEALLRRMMDECASRSKIWRVASTEYISWLRKSSPMNRGLYMVRTTSCSTTEIEGSGSGLRGANAALCAAWHASSGLVARDALCV